MATERPRPNPTVDEVLTIMIQEMRDGASPYLVDDDAAEVVRGYRPYIEEQLMVPGSWAQQGRQVRIAARQLGIIANAIAALHRESRVNKIRLEAASDVVRRHCTIEPPAGKQPGIWCGRRPPEP